MKTVGMPKKFWVVEYPRSKDTEPEDIFFESNYGHLITQGAGGLEEDQIYGVFANKSDARDAAEDLIEREEIRK